MRIHREGREREKKREAETQAEGEAGSMPGARRRTQSRDSRIAPWAQGRHQTTEPPRDPLISTLNVRGITKIVSRPNSTYGSGHSFPILALDQ